MKKLKTKIYFAITVLIVLAWMPKSFAQTEKDAINTMLNNWHKAAANANFDAYFSALTDDAIFIGTDATENWNKTQFMAFSKPYFDQKTVWDFNSLERHIYFDKSEKMAWFDELLDTSNMKICRGSGVLEKINGQWKIKHYVLSITIPNDDINAVIKIITPAEDALLEKLRK